MSAVNKVVKNTMFLYGKMGITMFASLYTTRLILNALGTSDFGIFNIVGGAISMLGFLNAAMAGATQRFMSFSEGEGNKEKQKKIFNISIVLHFVIAVILCMLLLIAGLFFFNGILLISLERIAAAKIVYGSLIVSTVFTMLTVPYDALLNAHENMLYYAIVGIVEACLKLVAALTIANCSFDDKLVLYGILTASIPIITMLIMRVYCHRNYEECIIAPHKYWDKRLMREMTEFAGWNLFSSASSMIVNYGQGIIMNTFFGVLVNTSQGVASQINGQLNSVNLAMMKALNPILDKSEGAGNRRGLIHATIYGSKMSIILMLFIFIPIWLEMPFILRVWLKEVPAFSIIFCRLLMINTLIGYSVLPISSSITAHGQIKKYQIVVSTLYYVPLLCMYVLFKLGFPAYYSYIMLGIYTLVASLITIHFANLNYGFPISKFVREVILKIILILLISLPITCTPLFLCNESALRLMLVIITFWGSFLTLLWFLGFDVEEKKMISKLVNTLLSRLSASKLYGK